MQRIQSTRAGFTLVELLAVIAILAFLIGILVVSMAGQVETAKVKLTRTFITEIEVANQQYEGEFGDWPPSSFTKEWGGPPNGQNVGAEALFLSLNRKEWSPPNLSEDKVDNSDADRSSKPLSSIQSEELFEYIDEWGNPIAYFHNRDYGKKMFYLTWDGETGDPVETEVEAKKNARFGNYFNPRGVQLISAGPDGIFNTADDIGNFDSKEQ